MPYLGDLHSTYETIPYGNAGIRISVSRLLNFIRQGRKNQQIVLFAKQLVQDCPNKDYICEAKTIFSWVQQNIRFTRDVRDVELLQTPDVTLRLRNGDCDDHVILLCTLLEAVGHRTRVVLVASMRDAPGQYNHIFAEVLLPVGKEYRWVPMDTTPVSNDGRLAPFGWLPPGNKYERYEV